MKVLSLNLGNFGSTGNIAQGIKNEANAVGMEYVLAYPVDPQNKPVQEGDWVIGDALGRKGSIALGMVSGFNGCFSLFSSWKLCRMIRRLSPDVIHFHNLHNNYVNLPMLFGCIKKLGIKVVWTLHDCWSFTGQCPYFDITRCEKWRTGCYGCPSYKEYPKALVDNTKVMWHLKKRWFCGVKDMTIVTPSQWLADLAKESYLKDYPVKVINNGIDLGVFSPMESDFAKRYGCEGKHIVLGVAFNWSKRKGFDVFCELAKRLDREKYQIVLVGTDDDVDKLLPAHVSSIHRTESQKELAMLYSAADVFANPTREENYPTVNMEVLACGTPIVTFRTGGSPEIPDSTCGCVVEKDDIDAMEREIIRVCEERPYSREACLQRAKSFDKGDRFREYVDLYKSISE